MLRLPAALLCLLILLSATLAQAARPLPDLHTWDTYFALFARDSSVPWKESSVRLDTYSGAPLDFAVYQVDPADIIVAGTNARPRVLDTKSLHPVARWKFTPPPGYRFESNTVAVPLGSREGFFVIEAQRGRIAEQVWINRTRIGLLSKASAGALLLYGADLGTGRALAHMRVSFLLNNRFDVRYTDDHGLIHWMDRRRPVFALAQYANSTAFLSFLPQAPIPNSVASLMVDSAVVHAGGVLRILGFARTRDGDVFKPASGTATLFLRSNGRPILQAHAPLDSAGAFVSDIHLPAGSPAGDYTALMKAGQATAGTTFHVEANAGGLSLAVFPACPARCPASENVPIEIRALREGVAAPGARVFVEVVRSPHAEGATGPQWGISKVLAQDVVTGADGFARISLGRPSDGLSSVYGVRVSSGGATASTRVDVPTASVALHIVLSRTEESLGNPVPFEVFATQIADEKPAAGLSVRVQLIHASSIAEQVVNLDAAGRGHGVFSSAPLGSDLIMGRATVGGQEALEAQEVQIVPHAAGEASGASSRDVLLSPDRSTYRVGERIALGAACVGALGDTLLTYETPLRIDAVVNRVRGGSAESAFNAENAPGRVQVGAAFVRDGELRWNTIPIALQGAGRSEFMNAHVVGNEFAPGSTLHLKIDEAQNSDRTTIIRMTAGIPSGSARFDEAPELLSIGETNSQDTAPPDADWHAWVDATPAHASTQLFDHSAQQPPEELSLAQADTREVYWQLKRGGVSDLQIPVPRTRGLYTISILEFGDDGHVAANSSSITVR